MSRASNSSQKPAADPENETRNDQILSLWRLDQSWTSEPEPILVSRSGNFICFVPKALMTSDVHSIETDIN